MMIWLYCEDEGGQVLAITAILMTLLLFLVAVVGDIGEAILLRIKVQNACDAGALAGASILRMGIDLTAFGNVAMFSSPFVAAIFKWDPKVLIQIIKGAQDMIIQAAPALSVIVAYQVAQKNGADMVVLLNDPRSDGVLPSLMLKRRRRGLIPRPEIIIDDLKTSRLKPHGDRYIRLGAVMKKREPLVGKNFLGKSDIPPLMAISAAAPIANSRLFRVQSFPFHISKTRVRLIPAGLSLSDLKEVLEEYI